ncbi:unnamed protein product [Cuscuta epithymum]|uniref:Protein ROOT HAIR DEFECTIVE 3 homolog n=1 Tax=Cuscuta epithymum TaxID=186058 RepID=A0AAV0GCJ0_9ASTE|nr:unnamed protein product [Cuscuta epithymum]
MSSPPDGSFSTQLIDGNGEFNVQGLQGFMDAIKFHQCGLSYAVVAIMGPQSSGKSTLLNHLFSTKFKEMDAYKGRNQTTKGIWIAKAGAVTDPCTIVIDLEGTDGRERGEDDTVFEKQSALFALAIADVVLINIWCHDIGRDQAANRPLLKAIFQVMMRLFRPRKTTLLFIIRDKTKTPLKQLSDILLKDIQKIWNGIPKPQAHKHTRLNDFFNVKVYALSSYEANEEKFKEEVLKLREHFYKSTSPGGIAGDRKEVVAASAFSYSAQMIWKAIKENKDLDLPAHKVMVATVRCEEIANEKLSLLTKDKDWLEVVSSVQDRAISKFGEKLSRIIDTYLSEYDGETIYFEESVKNAKRRDLELKILEKFRPAYISQLDHLCAAECEAFKVKLEQSLCRGEGFASSVRQHTQSCVLLFDTKCSEAAIKQAKWDSSKFREKLCHDIATHASSVRNDRLLKLESSYKKQLTTAITGPVESLLDAADRDTWACIRDLLKREIDVALANFYDAASGFELDEEEWNKMEKNFRDYARSVVETKARQGAGRILIRMKDRFMHVFGHDIDSIPMIWTGKENIKAITKKAQSASLNLLSIMAAMRLDDKPDKIESILFSSLLDEASSNSKERSNGVSGDPLASSKWEEVPPDHTLITPYQCKQLWAQFKMETKYTISQALSAQVAYRQNNNCLPPAWAILAMIVLGFNEFMVLLRSPLYLMVLFVVFLLGKAMWVQMDISRKFQNGTLSGLFSVLSRFLPTVMRLLSRLAHEAQGRPSPEPSKPLAFQSYRK